MSLSFRLKYNPILLITTTQVGNVITFKRQAITPGESIEKYKVFKLSVVPVLVQNYEYTHTSTGQKHQVLGTW